MPLYECLTRADRDLIDRGTGKGERNDRGYALAANLIATTDYLSKVGQRYEGDPRQLFKQYCQNCTPPIDNSEVESIWKSASQQTKTTSLPPDAILNCVKGWKWRQIRDETQKQPALKGNTESSLLRGDRAPVGKVVNHPTFNPLTAEELTQAVDRLIDQGLSQAQLEASIPALAKQSGYTDQVVWRIYRERLKEVEHTEK